MPWGVFKNKIKCNKCNEILIPENDVQWKTCVCGAISVMGVSFLRIKGKDYTDLGKADFSNVPEHNV